MSLGWKRFVFFDQQTSDAALPDSVCSCSGRNQLFFGTSSGEVSIEGVHQFPSCRDTQLRSTMQVLVLDRSLQQVRGWQAHAGGVKHMYLLEVTTPLMAVDASVGTSAGLDRDQQAATHQPTAVSPVQEEQQCTLLTVGAETAAQPASAALKAWDVSSHAAAGSAAAPQCTSTIKIFAQKLAEAEIISFAAQAEKLPLIRVALTLASGQILTLTGSCQGEQQAIVLDDAWPSRHAAPEALSVLLYLTVDSQPGLLVTPCLLKLSAAGKDRMQRSVLSVQTEGQTALPPITGSRLHGARCRLTCCMCPSAR